MVAKAARVFGVFIYIYPILSRQFRPRNFLSLLEEEEKDGSLREKIVTPITHEHTETVQYLEKLILPFLP